MAFSCCRGHTQCGVEGGSRLAMFGGSGSTGDQIWGPAQSTSLTPKGKLCKREKCSYQAQYVQCLKRKGFWMAENGNA